MIKINHNVKVKKDFVVFSGYMLSLSLTLVMFYTFIVAYMHPSKKVVVDINKFGEAHLEWFMIMILFDVIFLGLYYSYKKLGRKEI